MGMAEATVTLTIQDKQVTVPAGTLLVDAAKQAGVYIPVFCYHPKLEPVGMCRMCLVEIGRPRMDRQSGEMVVDEDGQPIIEYGPNLETACTTPVGEGWVVRASSDRARQGQAQIVEFLLTSHPLDCPVCDKGGECPLQELTMDFGAGKSRFNYGDKMHLGKHVPLGDLIFLDQERCIQCARCTRFQDEIVADPVIGFEERGRKLQIVTYSEPGFDSYFSGNTTDICPVGALTTKDFRFDARPWEMKKAASICTHCPVGCNTMVNTRRQPDSSGFVTVQRVMPRQNEAVNEIWLCDKGRFGHHYAGPRNRLGQPMVRREGELVETSWEEAVAAAVEGIKGSEADLLGLAGGKASNEDLFTFMKAVEALGGKAVLADSMAGGEITGSHGVAPGTNLGDLGKGGAVLVIASDLHEEAPIWWLRLKQAAERGASLIVANGRDTRLDRHASCVLRYAYRDCLQTSEDLLAVLDGKGESPGVGESIVAAANLLREAENVVVFFGREGLSLAQSEALAERCARIVEIAGRLGEANNGVVPVWPEANTQGAWDVGLRPTAANLTTQLEVAGAIWIMATDPVGDDPERRAGMEKPFVIVQELQVTATTEVADVVLPVRSCLEKEGTFTSGERRLQRFYRVLPAAADSRPDWQVVGLIAKGLGIEMDMAGPSAILEAIGEENPTYAGITYPDLALAESQWPPVGGHDLYFGGTGYANDSGLGVTLPLAPSREALEISSAPALSKETGQLLVPVKKLYDGGGTLLASKLLDPRRARAELQLHGEDAEALGLADGEVVDIQADGRSWRLPLVVNGSAPPGAALIGRGLGVPIQEPIQVELRRSEAGS